MKHLLHVCLKTYAVQCGYLVLAYLLRVNMFVCIWSRFKRDRERGKATDKEKRENLMLQEQMMALVDVATNFAGCVSTNL